MAVGTNQYPIVHAISSLAIFPTQSLRRNSDFHHDVPDYFRCVACVPESRANIASTLADWHSQVHGLFTLTQLEHTVATAFAILLATSLLTDIYAGTALSRLICIDTSTWLIMLLATHSVIP